MMIGGARKPMHEIVFGKYDTDGGGSVSVDEFRSMVYDMGHSLSEEELAIAVSQLDSNGDGSIDLYVCASFAPTHARNNARNLMLRRFRPIILATTPTPLTFNTNAPRCTSMVRLGCCCSPPRPTRTLPPFSGNDFRPTDPSLSQRRV